MSPGLSLFRKHSVTFAGENEQKMNIELSFHNFLRIYFIKLQIKLT